VTAFVIVGGLMVLAATLAVVWPLWRRRDAGRAAGAILAVSLVALPLLAVILYSWLSNWSWQQSPSDGGFRALEAQVEKKPNDADAWMTLGHAYLQAERFYRAADAYQHAYALTKGRNADAIIGFGESIALADEGSLSGRAGELFEQAYQVAPGNPKVLWYSGLAGYRSGRLDVARERWSQLIAQDPPPNVKKVLQDAIGQIDTQLAAASPNAAEPGASSPEPKGTPSGAGVVRVRVSVAPQLAGRVPAQAPLFVLVRGAERGPPLAVTRRTVADLPTLIELSDRDSMIDGRGLSGAGEVTVVARVARSGQPIASSGDLEGQVSYDVRSGKPVDLIINSVVP
jgi:cytochrome c-type biogenesis protein CcmH